VNYGQNLNVIHGLETMVCMAIEGAMQIDGGNWQIFDGMLKASNATTLLNTTVSEITKSKGRYSIKTTSKDESSAVYNNEEPFDTVVLAAPHQYSKIDFEKGLLKRTPDEIPYVTLHVTLFTSTRTLDPVYFNLTPGAEVPSSILTTLPPDEVPETPEDGVGSPGFFSISTLRQVTNPKTLENEYLYKIFSPKKVTSEFLSGILGVPSQYPLRISPSSLIFLTIYSSHRSQYHIYR
jgi:prenylcysteine oxidase/farnesylcysteine lyase